MVPLDDFLDNGKTDACTVLVLMLCPVEPLEQLGQFFLGYTSAVIFNDTEERCFCAL